MTEKSIVISGAGIAGLSIAHLLAEQGRSVVVVEKRPEVGGLARSYRYDDHIFDIGPHRFHSDDQHVLAYVRKVLEEECIEIPRSSGVRFFERYFDWPLAPWVILQLPPSILVRVAIDFLGTLYRNHEVHTFEDHILNMYGRTLYDNFFRDYTTKFLKFSPQLTHADWAKTGVDRAIIDERLKMDSLWQLFLSQFRTRPNTRFLYPKMGIGRFTDRLADRIRGLGGSILPATQVRECEHNGERITAVILTDDSRLEVSDVVWTAPVTEICDLLQVTANGLRYLDLVLYNIILDQPPRESYQWCYFGAYDIFFNRVSNPGTFSPAVMPAGRHGLCVEVTTMEGSQVWQSPERFTDEIIHDLLKVHLISSESSIIEIHPEQVENSYPIYDVNYRHRLDGVTQALSIFRNLHLAGRCGLFWYNNMDHSIANAFEVAARISGCEQDQVREAIGLAVVP